MHEGCFVKVAHVSQMWLVEDGERHAIADQAEMHAVGLRPVHTLGADELDAIPVEGQKPKRAKPKAKAPKPEPEADVPTPADV